jgi:hypothetical protein
MRQQQQFQLDALRQHQEALAGAAWLQQQQLERLRQRETPNLRREPAYGASSVPSRGGSALLKCLIVVAALMTIAVLVLAFANLLQAADVVQ